MTRQPGARSRLLAQHGLGTESGRLGEVGSLLRTVIMTSLIMELILAVFLVLRFVIAED